MRLLLASLLLATAMPALAQEKKAEGPAPKSHKDAMIAEAEADWVKPPVEEVSAVSHGSVTVRAEKIAYTATAGTLTIRDNDGKPIASVFYTAYTKDGGGNRPVTFFYNGGPGSATIWLHMGSLSPVRINTTTPDYVHPAPYNFGPNPNSLIDKSDLVFIDAIGAGWSRPLGDKTGKDFWGVDQDADAFARAITRYIDKNNRWTSPKFLFGESYGTLRSGAVAAVLEQRGVSLNGIVLLSTILNYGVRQPGYDQNYMVLLPGYAATAWYHHRLANRPDDLPAFLAEVRRFVSGPYAAALAKGDTISPEEAQAVAKQMAAYTGLSEAFILRANLRVDLAHFQTELLRDQREVTGRLDSRYLGDVADANAESPIDDPTSTATTGAYTAIFNDYAARTLGFKTQMPYKLSAREQGWDWDWRHRAPGSNQPQPAPNTAVDLAYTMRTNPYLKVLFLNGYYDMATPFYGTEFDANHMQLDESRRRNISFKYYEAGHMIYLNPDALAQLHNDLAAWYDAAKSQ
ncbi:S10 family peptidase [Sphingomonas sp. GlSt437]|uniref:S10 family peptidase n=1 Tax=Sphingomonas sp. GlSt437 TaxID=3389970 RepID=UPI003A8AD4E6